MSAYLGIFSSMLIDTAKESFINLDTQEVLKDLQLQCSKLSTLPEESIKKLQEALKYSAAHKRLTKKYIRSFLLPTVTYPTLGSQLMESINQLNQITDKLLEEIFKAENLKIAYDQFLKCNINEPNQKDINGFEIKYALSQAKIDCYKIYKDMTAWKEVVEEILSEMNTTFDQVDFAKLAEEEMLAKIFKWGELEASQMLEFSPDKLAVVMQRKDIFKKGFEQGLNKNAQQELNDQVKVLEKQIDDLDVQASLLASQNEPEKAAEALEMASHLRQQVISTKEEVKKLELSISK